MNKNPCSQDYRGKSALSEPETQAVSDVLMQNRGRVLMYVTLHSYSQMILTPFGTTTTNPDNYPAMVQVAQAGLTSLAKARRSEHYGYARNWSLGSARNLLYTAPGTSADFAYSKAGVRYSYTFELPDTGYYQFLIPKSHIPRVGADIANMLYAMSQEIIALTNKS